MSGNGKFFIKALIPSLFSLAKLFCLVLITRGIDPYIFTQLLHLLHCILKEYRPLT